MQNCQPFEVIIIDGSSAYKLIEESSVPNLKSKIVYQRAIELGAAKQRNQGIALANMDVIGFFDDDIILEKDILPDWVWLPISTQHKLLSLFLLVFGQI